LWNCAVILGIPAELYAAQDDRTKTPEPYPVEEANAKPAELEGAKNP
jgi:hypothetical protein